MRHLIPITQRVKRPSPEEVRAVRERAGLTQEQAATLVSPASRSPYKTWAAYETPVGNANHRAIPLATWELFLLLVEEHPTTKLIQKNIEER